MWRFWNCVPRFVRHQLHGPRASAGVCVEEEKADHEAEKLVVNDSAQGQHNARDTKEAENHGCRWRLHRSHYSSRFWKQRKQGIQETDSKDDQTLHVQLDQRKEDHCPHWSPFWRRPALEKSVLNEGVQEQHVGAENCPGTADRGPQIFGWKRHTRHCRFQRLHKQETDHGGQADPQKGAEQEHFWYGMWVQDSGDGASDYDHSHWWKQRCQGQSWFQMWCHQRSLDAVTWGAGMVFGIQLSRKPHLQNFLEMWKDRDKRDQWWNLLLQVAFSKPPEAGRHSIVQGPLPQRLEEAVTQAGHCAEKPLQMVPEAPVTDLEDKKTLSDVMREFEVSCRQYAAVASSVSGLLLAEQGKAMAAVEHLHQASRLGHAPAYFNLALCYDMGLGVKKDHKQAAAYYQLAADLGHAQAVFNLALMTLNGDGGLTKDRNRAFELLNKAATQGLAQAQIYLGVYYTENDDKQQDFEEAVAFFQAAASQNDAEGQYFLGICYENGWGLESNDNEAARLYTAAAELGHDGALYNLAAFYEYGLGGLQRDEEHAFSLYRRAAQLGNENAKFRLDEHEARKAVSLWAERNREKVPKQSPPGLHPKSPHCSSSPVFSDYVRHSIMGVWSGELTAWSSAQSLTLSSPSKLAAHQRATQALGDGSDRDSASCIGSGHAGFSEWLDAGSSHGCFASLQRTATMPELRMVSCQ